MNTQEPKLSLDTLQGLEKWAAWAENMLEKKKLPVVKHTKGTTITYNVVVSA